MFTPRLRITRQWAKRLGMWTADKIGLKGSDAESYAKMLMAIDLRHHDEGEIATKVRDDLQAAGASTSETEIRQLMHELLAKAIEEIKNGR